MLGHPLSATACLSPRARPRTHTITTYSSPLLNSTYLRILFVFFIIFWSFVQNKYFVRLNIFISLRQSDPTLIVRHYPKSAKSFPPAKECLVIHVINQTFHQFAANYLKGRAIFVLHSSYTGRRMWIDSSNHRKQRLQHILLVSTNFLDPQIRLSQPVLQHSSPSLTRPNRASDRFSFPFKILSCQAVQISSGSYAYASFSVENDAGEFPNNTLLTRVHRSPNVSGRAE